MGLWVVIEGLFLSLMTHSPTCCNSDDSSPRFFTYCLLDDELNFAETGKTTAKDFTSKHAMHSCAKEEVRYAGEFHVRQDKGRHVLVVDNNSGTYAPPKEFLPHMKSLLEYNFPGLKVNFVLCCSDWDR